MELQNISTQTVTLLHKVNQTESGRFYLQKRYLVAFLAFVGWIFLYIMRTNLSISIVDMTSNRTTTVGNETFVEAAQFNWTSTETGIILASFALGYLSSPLGALVAKRYGGVSTFGAGIALTALLTMASPVLLSWNLYAYLIARILEGVFEGVSASSYIEAIRVWSAPQERSQLMAMPFSGYIVGAMLGFPMSGIIAYHLGWKAVFYITGGASLMFSLIWFAVLRNYPEDDNFMTIKEKQFLKKFNQTSKEKMIYPWRQIFTSKATWAYWNDRFVAGWSESFLLYSLPLYIKDVHDINIQDIGFLSGMPNICAALAIIVGSILADYIRNHRLLSISNVHRLFLSFAQFVAIVLLITVSLSENFITSIICFCLFRQFFTICQISYEVLPIDIGGQYGSFILGFSLTAFSLSFGLSPIVMGLMVTHHSASEWNKYFLILSFFNLWGGIIFYKFGSGELQPWAVPLSDLQTSSSQTDGVRNTASNDLRS